MNDMMIVLARMRRSEMAREADQEKLASRLRRAARRAARAPRAAGGPAIRLAAARTRPTVTGR
jgi:hypothetical protein